MPSLALTFCRWKRTAASSSSSSGVARPTHAARMRKRWGSTRADSHFLRGEFPPDRGKPPNFSTRGFLLGETGVMKRSVHRHEDAGYSIPRHTGLQNRLMFLFRVRKLVGPNILNILDSLDLTAITHERPGYSNDTRRYRSVQSVTTIEIIKCVEPHLTAHDYDERLLWLGGFRSLQCRVWEDRNKGFLNGGLLIRHFSRN